MTVLLGWLPQLHSQVIFTASNETVCEGETIDIEITVEDFTSVTSLSFPIFWDVDVMTYTGNTISLPAVAGLNDLNAPTGELRFTWFDPTPPPPPPTIPGITLANNTVILTLHFQAVGTYTMNSTTPVELTGPGFPSQVFTEGNLTPAPSSFVNGSASIADTEDPVISSCPMDINMTVPFGTAPTVVTWTEPSATDNCVVSSFTSTHASGDMFPEGTTTVTYTAVDEAGNSTSSCSFDVVILESPDPNAVSFVASDVSLSCDDSLFSVTVNVFNYDNPTAMQFGLAWDPAILEYQSTTLPGGFPPTPSFNDGFQANGELRYTWFDASPPLGDEVFAQGELLMTIDFKLLDLGIDSTTVEFSEFTTPPFAIKISDTGGQIGTNDLIFEDAVIRNYPDTMPIIDCPADTTLSNDAGVCGRTFNFVLPTVTDDCDAPAPALVQTSALGEGDLFPVGMSTVSYTATDSKGNMATCSFVVTINDDEDPVATCPTLINDIVLDGTGNGTLPANIGDGSSTDNCSVTETSPSLSFTCSDLGTQTVTLTATDGSSNSTTALCSFNVVDNTGPTAVCPATIADVVLDGSGNGTLPANIGDGSSTDNCSVIETSPSLSFSCTDIGVQSVTLTATDGSNNTSTASCSFNVVDNTDPTAVCQDATIYLDALGGTTIGALEIDGGSTDNCGVTSASTMPFSFNCSNLGANSVTLTVGDDSGNSDMCIATVTVLDTVPPTAICQNDTLYLDGTGEAVLAAMDIDNGATDACGIDMVTISQDTFDCSDIGDNTITLYVNDDSGNVDSCMATVTVLDTVPPTAICQNDTLYLDASGNASLAATDLENGSTDNCGVDEITASQTDFDCTDVGDNMVTVYVSDASDNVDSCMATVTVFDTLAPTLSCPGDINISVPAGTVDTMLNMVSLISSDDNCGIDTTYVVLSGALSDTIANDAAGTSFPIGTTNVEYFVVDESGNVDSCDFDVTVIEGSVLSIACPSDVSQGNDADECFATVSGLEVTIPSGMATDTSYALTGATTGSGNGNIPDPTIFNIGTTTVTYTALNANDTVTCSFTVMVSDTTAPSINCPSPLTLGNDAGVCGLTFSVGLVPAIANDNCGDATITTSPYSVGDLVPVGGPYDITAIAVDTSGNADTCVYQLTVNDVESPTWSACPLNIVNVPNDTGECGAIVTWDEPMADDNCAVIAITPPTNPNGSLFPAGETTLVEYVAVDAAGNTAKCSFTVSVVDVEPPSIAPCPGNISQANDTGECSAVVTWPNPLPDDNCGVVSFVSSGIPTGNEFPVGGPYQVGYSATDEAGNTTVCSFEVTVMDAELPQIINMPTDITIPADAGECGAVVNWTVPTAEDNCGIQSFAGSNSPGEFFAVTSPGTPHVVNYTATDINGNVTVGVFMITVVDDQLPEFDDCPVSNVVVNVDGTTTSPVIAGTASIDCENIQLNLNGLNAMDNCGPVSIAQTFGPASGDIFPIGISTLTFEATDVNGNQSTCSFNIIVEGVPVAGAQAFPTNPCEGDDVDFFVTNEVPGATYTWKDPSGAVVSNEASFTLPSISATQTGDFTLEVTLPFCQQDDAIGIQVFENPIISIDYNDVLCTDGTVPLVLNGINTSGAVITEWMWTTPGIPAMTAFGQTLTITDPTTDDAGIYTLQATSNNGCSATVQTTDAVIVSEEPPMPDLFSTPTAICLGESMVLNGEPFAGANVEYQWSADPLTGSGLPNPAPNNPVIEVTPTEAGTFTYFYTVIVDGCASQMAEVAVQVESAPVVSIDVDGETTCLTGDTDITLSVVQSSGSPIVDYFWTPGNTTDPDRVITNATADSAGMYSVMVATALGCSNTSSINLNDLTDALVTPTITPENDSLCLTTNTTINVFPSYPSGTTYNWSVNGVPQPSSLPALQVTPDMVGTTEITLVVSLDGCESAVATTQVVALEMGPLSVSVDGATECLDGTSTVTLVANAAGATTYEWINQGVFGAELPITNATSDDSGPYVVVARNNVGCVGQITFLLELTDALPELTAFLESAACDMEDLALCAEPTISGATYEWTGPTGAVIATTQCPTITNASDVLDGNYTVTASFDGCTTTSEPLAVDVLMPPTANNEVVVGIVNQAQSFNVVVNDIVEGDYTISVVEEPNFGSVSYNGDGVFTYNPQADFRETDRMAYEICYEDCPDACDIAIVTLLIRFPGDQCIATTVITPNNDGINDEFVVSCLEVQDYPENTLYIFNEWGDEVFDAAPYENNWRGTFNGKDLPDGTYFYIFQSEPNVPAQKGFVMIHR